MSNDQSRISMALVCSVLVQSVVQTQPGHFIVCGPQGNKFSYVYNNWKHYFVIWKLSKLLPCSEDYISPCALVNHKLLPLLYFMFQLFLPPFYIFSSDMEKVITLTQKSKFRTFSVQSCAERFQGSSFLTTRQFAAGHFYNNHNIDLTVLK